MADADVETPLTEAEARSRASRVSHVCCALRLVVGAGEEYAGSFRAAFNYNAGLPAACGLGGDSGVFLDFTGRSVSRLRVNGSVPGAGAVAWRAQRLWLAGAALRDGANVVQFEFVGRYAKNGAGLHSFTDPEDGETYLYTHFEPFDAHRAMPCFDQPDLKATWAVALEVPRGWVALANGRPAARSELPGCERDIVQFDVSPLLSSYIFAVVAGPYDCVTDVWRGTTLGVYCRRRLSAHLDAGALFRLTKAGLDWYGEYFGMPYPYPKYDQVFAPEFNIGAMENVGTVTFTERYVFREPPTESQLGGRADTLLHEMAHMWFGDLVTPAWWDGLWLKESFATYMAALCVSEATEFGPSSWLLFANRMKAWAYSEDQLRTTHGIQPEAVVDTDAVFLNFDGITYGKGASVLKQLVAVVGPAAFRAACRAYTARHAWGTASLADFLAAVQDAVGAAVDVRAWAAEWLVAPGLNTLAPELTLDAGGCLVRLLRVSQSAPDAWPTLRSHTLEVAFHDAAGVVMATLRVVVAGPSTEVALPPGGLALPRALAYVNANHDDHAYAKIALDPLTLAFARSGGVSPRSCPSPLNRQLLYDALWDMTRDARLPATAYVGIALRALPEETNAELAASVLRRCDACVATYLRVGRAARPAEGLYQLCARLAVAPGGPPSLRTVYTRAMPAFAGAAAAGAEALVALLDTPAPGGPVLDQGARWAALAVTAARGAPGTDARIEGELARDGSDRGRRGAVTARAAVPDAAVKAAAWAAFVDPASRASLHEAAAAMAGFWLGRSGLPEGVQRFYEDAFFGAVGAVFETRGKQFAQAFFGALVPRCDDDGAVLARVRARACERPCARLTWAAVTDNRAPRRAAGGPGAPVPATDARCEAG